LPEEQLTWTLFVIDKHNAAVEPRKGALAVSAMFSTVFAARMVYWMTFLRFRGVGMVGAGLPLQFWIYIWPLLTCIISVIWIKWYVHPYTCPLALHNENRHLSLSAIFQMQYTPPCQCSILAIQTRRCRI
jgi:hypothetical protein